jgi:prepilin-type processing-associated H-X9-DG protein/prepilin-type N-terminal cleavage/methylation domain-containing protein
MHAFTLIELLVVIAVIAILVALLVPGLARAKGKAKSVACLSNVKQWSLAMQLYLEDNNDRFPYEGWTGEAINAGKNVNAWYNAVPPLAKVDSIEKMYASGRAPVPGSRSIFTCPTVRDGPTNAPTVDKPYFMYGFNNRLDPNDAGGIEHQFRLSQVVQPVETVIFTENSENQFPSTAGRYTPARHSGRANLAFVDGHVEPTAEKDFRRTDTEDQRSALEWRVGRKVYWYPFNGAPE